MDDTEELTRPNITDAGPRTFHWLCTVTLLLIMPSISTSLSFAGRLHPVSYTHLDVYKRQDKLLLRSKKAIWSVRKKNR